MKGFTKDKNKMFKIVPALVISSCIFLMGNTEVVNADNINSNTKIEMKTTVGTVKPCDYLNIRKGPSSSNSVVGKTYSNETVTILETNSNGWHKIQTKSGVVGWASGAYISVNGAGQTNQNSQVSTTTDAKISKLVEFSKKQLGKPYVWGASGPNGFDCSGFTYYVFKNGAGITLPRTSKSQATAGTKVDRKDLRAGDLVFFATGSGGISHVGMYIGNGNFIHSTQPGDTVKIHSINSSYYSRTFVTARRVIN